jgi:hypothetical protein
MIESRPIGVIRIAAHRVAAAVASDPSLARDEARLAALIRDELEVESRIARIPACLRDDR